MPRLLFVCLGNICRSPMAEAICRHRAAERGLEIDVDSAGTGAWHAGEQAHEGTRRELTDNGIDASGLIARQVDDSDFFEADLILAMDESNLADLAARRLPNATARMALMLDWLDEPTPRDVPDPYYVGGFDVVFRLIDDATHNLLDAIEAAGGDVPAAPA